MKTPGTLKRLVEASLIASSVPRRIGVARDGETAPALCKAG